MPDRIPKIYYSNAGEETDAETLRRRNNRMIQTTIVGIFLLILVLVLVLGWNPQIMDENPQPTGEASEDIDTSQDPLQTSYTGENIKRTISGDEFTIVPVANYEISAMLESMKSYSASLGFNVDRLYAKISPVDLCLVWGKLAEPGYDKYITYRQGKRNCEARSSAEAPFDFNYQITHVSNNHIIPATENVHNAIKSIQNKEKVVLKGVLVNVMLKSNGQEYMFLKTSLIRSDWGLEGCEVFYVEKVRIGNKIYE